MQVTVLLGRERERASCLFLYRTGSIQNPKPLVHCSNAPEPISISFPKPQTSCVLQQCSCPYLPLFAIALRVFCFTNDVSPRRKNTSSLGASGTINGSQNANTAAAASLENCLPASLQMISNMRAHLETMASQRDELRKRSRHRSCLWSRERGGATHGTRSM
jgi:hypothetical protein